MDNFILKTEYYEILKDLSIENKALLFDAIFQYHLGVKITLGGEVGIAFKFMKSFFDKNKETYQKVCNRNKANGTLGGRPSNKNNPNNPVGFSITQDNPNNPKSKSKSKSKSNITKEIYKPQNLKKDFEEESFEYSISKYFLDDLVNRGVPSIIYQLSKKSDKEIIEAWCPEVRRMLTIDKLTPEQIKYIVKFACKDEFWSTVILTMMKFRQKKDGIPYYITLIGKIKDSGGFKKDTSKMSGDEALLEAKRRGLV